MTVKVFVKRHIKSDQVEEAFSLLKQFRSSALDQPGYISGETLVDHYDPHNVMVVSTWQSVEDWISWQESGERAHKETQLEALLGQPTKYEIYDVGMSTKG
jgi:heme-degrading monooxygenase HmoA